MENPDKHILNDEKYAIKLHQQEAKELEKLNKIPKKNNSFFKIENKYTCPLPKKDKLKPCQKNNHIKYSQKKFPEKIESNFGVSDYIPDNMGVSTNVEIIEKNKNLNNSTLKIPKKIDMNRRMKLEGSIKKTVRPDESNIAIKVDQESNLRMNDEPKNIVSEKNIRIFKEYKKKFENDVNLPISSIAKLEKYNPKFSPQAKPSISNREANQLIPNQIYRRQPAEPHKRLSISRDCPAEYNPNFIFRDCPAEYIPHYTPENRVQNPGSNISGVNRDQNIAAYNNAPDTYESLLELDRDAYDLGKGFNPKDLKKFIVSVFKSNKQNFTCSICYVDLEVGQNYIILPCVHYYHEDCIKNWLCRKKICPICTSEVKLD